MNSSELRQRLASLHQQLGVAPTVDEESRQLLRELRDDIERALEQAADDELSGAAPPHRLEALATRFEADHPALAGAMRQVIDVLVKAGL